MINIVVVDDHPLMLKGVKIAVDSSIDMEVTGEASNWQELLEILDDHIPDIVILDINIPQKSGLDILKDLQNRHPNLPVLILSMHSEERFAIRALKAGAKGYLNKSSISDELEKAIRRIVTRNKRYITPKVAELISDQVSSNNHSMPHESLTDREFQIFCKIASGETVNDIADDLCLSTQTVYTYRANIKEKMNFDSNVEMALYAINNNLIEG